MSIEPGRQLLHYRLIDKIGEGGMGVVWKAVDANLNREVAIKILPDLLIEAPDRKARFEREAKLLATLNHPNIATVYGFHDAEGVSFLAMELVEGEDLAERLVRGPLSIVDALETAQRIADGLAAAHDKGVVHRDLKPANVKRAPDGTVKVLDFGLAKSVEGGSPNSSTSLSLSPTMTSAGSIAGMIMGTAGYMSPEQARGKPVDARTDVWAFGCLLYEMLTGKRLFEGETVSDILAAVLKTEPDWSQLPAETPPAARRLLERCLQRDPRRRLHHMADARLEIDEALENPAPLAEAAAATAPARAASGKERFAWIGMIVVLLAALAAVALWPRVAPQPPLVQSMLMPPDGWDFAAAAPFALSRDGRQVAFVANPRPDNDAADVGSSGLWVRDLGAAEARRLADADTDTYPFWSPDGRWIGFYAGGKLNKIEARGGPVIVICDATDGRGGSWNETGTIIFQRRWSEGLMKVPAGGGEPEPATTLDKDRFDVAHRWPHFLPDGRRFLFYVVSTTNPVNSEHSGIYVGSLDSDETRQLLRSESRALYARGHLLYRIGTTLMAHRFDPSTVTLTGDPSPVAVDVSGGVISWGGAHFGVSEADVLVHGRGMESSLTVLNWRDRDGNIQPMGEPGGLWDPAISRDGKRLAVAVGLDSADIWIYDLEHDTQARFTFDPSDDRTPLWSPDGGRLAFVSGRDNEGEIWLRSTSGQGVAERVFTAGTDIVLTDWSADGRRILFNYLQRDDDSMDVWALDLETGEAAPLLSGPAEQMAARFSPDGKWLVVSSDESGNSEIYVQTFPDAGGRWMVSSDGGTRGAYGPVWRSDGRELYYLRSNWVVAVPVTPGAGFPFGTPRPLFAVNIKSGQGSAYDVTDEGRRFLTNELPPADPTKSGARLILNWSTALGVR